MNVEKVNIQNSPYRYHAYSGDKCKCGTLTNMRSDGWPHCSDCYDAMLAAREEKGDA